MNIRMSSVLTTVLLSVSVVGCIKEKREFCPCLLVVDFSGIGKEESDSLSLSVFSSDDILYGRTVHNDAYGSRLSIEVPKGTVGLNVFSFAPVKGGLEWSRFEDDRGTALTVPQGSECPAVYTHFAQIDTRREIHTEYVIPLKNFCRLSVLFRTENPSSYKVSLLGNVCGYARDGTPADGVFSFSPEIGDDGRFAVRIPRQKDGSLCLLIDDGGGVVRRFALGDYLIQSGYDWSEPSLRDADVVIDYATTEIVIMVNGWEHVFSAEVMI
ncbi:MAG: hypothetical protein ACI395_10220 [Candidatus Cryptobacteroides sp.]